MYHQTYFCVCDGKQEEMYLKHLAYLLKIPPRRRVVAFNTTCGSIERLKHNYTEYDNALLFDYDYRNEEFRKKILECQKIGRRSKKEGGKKVYHAYSNVNFDLWLILHKEDFNRSVDSNGAYVDDVRRIYNLNREADIKQKGNIERILHQINLENVKSAIRRADRIRGGKIETDRQLVGDVVCYDNPDFSLHEFLKTVLKDCGEID